MGLIDVYIKPRSEEERKNDGMPWLEGEQWERAEKALNPLWEVREKLPSGRPYICELVTETNQKKRHQVLPRLYAR
jgi:hypothetical protein